MDWIERWVEESPYTAALGVEPREITPQGARFHLPFREQNSNPGQALHGGVAASMVVVAAQSVARAALGEEAGPWHSHAVQVTYLAAAIGEAIFTEARLLRRGKELCFVDVAIASEAQKPIAHGLVAVRGRFASEPTPCPLGQHLTVGEDPGPMGPHIGRVPFMGRLGLSVEHMAGGTSRLVLPWIDANGDGSQGVHEGAILSLLDTTGAMAAWSVTGPGRYRASTPVLQAQILAPPDGSDLVAHGRVVFRDQEIFFSEVEVVRAQDSQLVARGTVHYRIVV